MPPQPIGDTGARFPHSRHLSTPWLVRVQLFPLTGFFLSHSSGNTPSCKSPWKSSSPAQDGYTDEETEAQGSPRS
jgi:hypothetical protein